MDKEFCFKDLFSYYLKRWLIVAVSIFLGVVLFLTAFVLKDKRTIIEIKATAYFYGISDFLADTTELGLSDENSAVVSLYYKTAADVYNAMNSDYVKASFVNSNGFLNSIKELFKEMSLSTDIKDEQFVEFFSNSVGFEVREDSYSIIFKGMFNTQKRVELAGRVLSLYLEQAALFAYEKGGIKPDSITILNPIKVVSFIGEGNGFDYFGEYIKSLIYGIGVGALVGALIIFLLYTFDTRLKSFEMQMSEFGGGLIAVNSGTKVDSNTVLSIISRFNKDKTLLIAAGKKDEHCFVLSNAIAKRLAELNFKTLLIDLSFKGGKSFLQEVKKSQPELETLDGYYRLSSLNKDEFSAFISHKKEYEKLALGFDKILISYCEEGNGGVTVLKDFADKALYVVNQANTKFSTVLTLSNQLKKEGLVIGTYIYNPI